MNFIPKENSNKLQIVPENRDEEAWLTTTKNKGVKQGDEKFVIRAYNQWRRQPHDAEAIISASKAKLAESIRSAMLGENSMQPQQTAEHEQRLERGQVITRANQLLSQKLHECLVFDQADGMLWIRGHKDCIWPIGSDPKHAKVVVCNQLINQLTK